MKPKHALLKTAFSTREMVAMTALLTAGYAAAAEATPAKPKEDPKKKKDGEESQQSLGDMLVEAVRQSLYRPENVTSQKYTVPLRDVPQTVTVIPKQVIQEQGATTLTEVLRNVPGISIQAGEGGGASSTAGDMFNMRGFNASNSIFVDGVRDDGLVSRDTFNLEAVEAFLGPTGSDVGRGTASGYINMATKSPKLENTYAGGASVASGERFRATGDINQNLGTSLGLGSDDWLSHAALRVNGLYQTGGVPGRDYVERNTYSIAPSLAFGLGTDTRLILQAQYLKQDNIPDYGVPARNGYTLPTVDPEWYYGSVYDHDDVTQKNFTARLEHDFNENLQLRTQVRYSENDRFAVITSPAYNVANNWITRSRQGSIRDNEIFSTQTSLTAKFNTGPLEHAIVGALEYTYDSQEAPGVTGLGTAPVVPFPFAPNPYFPVAGANFAFTGFGSVGSTDTLGLSLFDTIKWGEHWQLSGGIRTDTYETRYHSTTATTNVYAMSDDTLLSGKIALTYKPVKEGSVYLGYSTNQTPPGTANFTLSTTATNQNNPNLDPQESENIELGTKWDFFNAALTATAAVFHTENTNVIYVSDPGPPQVYSVDGGQEINGATFGVAGKITENWSIIANAAFLDAKLDQPGNANNGKDLTLTPEFSGSIWTTYKLPYNFTIAAGPRYQESVFINAGNTIKVPSYAVLDAMVQYDVNENVKLRLNVYNVLDREYRASINNNGQRYNPGAPLSAMFTTEFKF